MDRGPCHIKAMHAPIIEVAGLTKTFNGVTAVAGIDFTVSAGETVALLGGVTGTGNGAGRVKLPVPIPAQIPQGVRVYRQWLLANQSPVNALGVTVSNARVMKFR